MRAMLVPRQEANGEPEFPEPMQHAVNIIETVNRQGLPMVAFFFGDEVVFCAQHPRSMAELRDGKLQRREH